MVKDMKNHHVILAHEYLVRAQVAVGQYNIFLTNHVQC